jgi:hypothetical protein
MSTSNQTSTTTATYQSKEIESFIESSWVSIKDKETKVLEFIPGKTKTFNLIGRVS